MATDSHAPEVAIWVDDTHTKTVQQLVDLMGSAVKPIGLGGPRNTGVDDLAAQYDLPRLDDPRKLLVDHPTAYLLLATPQGIDTADLAAALAQGTHILALEPACQTLADFAELERPTQRAEGLTTPRGRLIHLPLMVQSAGLLAAADPHDALGDTRVIAFQSVGPADQGSAYARLMDAWMAVLAFAPMPETIDAQLTGPLPAAPDDPRSLQGTLTAHARLPETGSANLLIADNAPATSRSLRVLGSDALLDAAPNAYTLQQRDGERLDHLDAQGPMPAYTDQLANQWRRLLDARPAPTEQSTRREQDALACALACLLSARTGQPESPQRLVQMSRH